MGKDEELVSNYSRLESYISNTARRFAVPGKIDIEDLSQAALILVNRLMEDYPNCCCDEFDALARTAIHNRVIDLVRPFLSKKRDYHKENVVVEDLDIYKSPQNLFWWCKYDPDLLEAVHYQDLCISIEQTFCNSETRRLWRALTFDPAEMDHALQARNAEVDPAHPRHSLTYTAIANHLDWTLHKVQYHMNLIRKSVRKFLGDKYLESVLHCSFYEDKGIVKTRDLEQIESVTKTLLARNAPIYEDHNYLGDATVTLVYTTIAVESSWTKYYEISMLCQEQGWMVTSSNQFVSWGNDHMNPSELIAGAL